MTLKDEMTLIRKLLESSLSKLAELEKRLSNIEDRLFPPNLIK